MAISRDCRGPLALPDTGQKGGRACLSTVPVGKDFLVRNTEKERTPLFRNEDQIFKTHLGAEGSARCLRKSSRLPPQSPFPSRYPNPSAPSSPPRFLQPCKLCFHQPFACFSDTLRHILPVDFDRYKSGPFRISNT